VPRGSNTEWLDIDIDKTRRVSYPLIVYIASFYTIMDKKKGGDGRQKF
jgi:hypothetical protein